MRDDYDKKIYELMGYLGKVSAFLYEIQCKIWEKEEEKEKERKYTQEKQKRINKIIDGLEKNFNPSRYNDNSFSFTRDEGSTDSRKDYKPKKKKNGRNQDKER